MLSLLFGLVRTVAGLAAGTPCVGGDHARLHRTVRHGGRAWRGHPHEYTELRMRLKAMTATAIPTGLFPIVFGRGASSGVMRSTGALMVGGMITAPVRSRQTGDSGELPRA